MQVVAATNAAQELFSVSSVPPPGPPCFILDSLKQEYGRTEGHRSGGEGDPRPRGGYAVPALAHALRDRRRRGVPQVREPPVHRLLQGARGAEQARLPRRGPAQEGRDRLLRRQ